MCAITDSRIGIQTFKAFLDSFSEVEAENTARTSILKEYLESQKPHDDGDNTAVYLADIMQRWSLASQSNDERLVSACPAVLALLLKTISPILELSEYGIRLGKTLLLRRQQELVSRGVTSNKTKDALISPALRLLREVTIFDGGHLAKQVFRTRDMTFKSLARNLGLKFQGDGVELPRKPSVRTNALRFVLALIKFLPTELRREFLNQRDTSFAMTRHISEDPPFMLREMLETLKSHVLLDEALPRDAKTKAVNATSLTRISSLYRYDQAEIEEDKKKPISTLAHDFLLLACTSPAIGVLHHQTGFYPRGINPDETHNTDGEDKTLDLGLDNIDWMNKFTDKIPVRNTVLSEFIQTLRPWSILKQSELLLSILKAAPELVADYFYGKRTFSFDPKPTEIWIAYSALVFSALQIPVPAFFGHQDGYARLPPPQAIVLENLLPLALTQKIMTRCLHHEEKIISFYAIRLLSEVLLKLQKILVMYREAAEERSSIWTQAAERLMDEFCARCPSIKEVISVFRNMPQTDLMQREATTRLLVLYYEIIPRAALDAKFDVSATLAQTLQALEEHELSSKDRALRFSELQNLFQFAHYSPGMRWFAKADKFPLSPFTSMLELSTRAPEDVSSLKVESVLDVVVEENQILQMETSVSALDSLLMILRSLSNSKDLTNLDAIYAFLDDCISRCAANPVKYIFAMEEVLSELDRADKRVSLSLLTLAMVEQWPFLVQASSIIPINEVSQFLARYLAASIKLGEDKKAIKLLTKRLVDASPHNSLARTHLDRSRKLVDSVKIPEARASTQPDSKQAGATSEIYEQERKDILASMLGEPKDLEDHSALTRWVNKDIEEVIEDGHISALVVLLSSSHLHVRKEALINITKLSSKLKESSYEEKEQIWLLLSELVETAKSAIDQDTITSIITAFASQAIAVLTNPLHPLYEKVNFFLSQGPTWHLDKIPLFHKILDEVPTLDDARYTEISWLLEYLLVDLQTEPDLTVFRKQKVFEKLLSLYNSPFISQGIRSKILKLLFRTTGIEGGCTTLVTRFSIVSWLQGQIAGGGGTVLKVLLERIFDGCDASKVNEWSRGGVKLSRDEVLKDD